MFSSWERLAVSTALATCLAAGVFDVSLSGAEIVRVAPLAREGRILVSFELAGAFTEEVRAAIQSGLPTTFTYMVELRRATTFWFDRTQAAVRMSVSVRYDNLHRRYQVSHMMDGRVEDTRVVEDEETVRRLMTSFEQVPFFSTTPLEPNAEYYVRVRAATEPRSIWFFWPWGRVAASGSAKFTFIP